MIKNVVVIAALLGSTALSLPRAALADAICDLNETVSVYWAKDANTRGKWYSAKVLKVNNDGSQCYVRYAGFDSSWDDWVGRDRLKHVDGRTPLVQLQPSQPQSRSQSQSTAAPAVEYQVAHMRYEDRDWVFVKVSESFITAPEDKISRYYNGIVACARQANFGGQVVAVSDGDGTFRYYGPRNTFSIMESLDMEFINSNLNKSMLCNV